MHEVRDDVRLANDRLDLIEARLNQSERSVERVRETAPVNKPHEVGKVAARVLLSSEQAPITVKSDLTLVIMVCLLSSRCACFQ